MVRRRSATACLNSLTPNSTGPATATAENSASRTDGLKTLRPENSIVDTSSNLGSFVIIIMPIRCFGGRHGKVYVCRGIALHHSQTFTSLPEGAGAPAITFFFQLLSALPGRELVY